MIVERIGGRREEQRGDFKYEEGTHSINPHRHCLLATCGKVVSMTIDG